MPDARRPLRNQERKAGGGGAEKSTSAQTLLCSPPAQTVKLRGASSSHRPVWPQIPTLSWRSAYQTLSPQNPLSSPSLSPSPPQTLQHQRFKTVCRIWRRI